MAKKNAEVNKSLEIRSYMNENPKAKPREVVDALKEKGVDVSAQFVSTVKSNSKKSVGVKRRGRPVGSTKKTPAAGKAVTAKGGETVSVQSLLKLKRVVEEIGSIEEAKAALSTLERLSD